MYSYKETDVFQFVHRLFWKDVMPHKFMYLLSLKDTFPGTLSCYVLDQFYLPITMTLHIYFNLANVYCLFLVHHAGRGDIKPAKKKSQCACLNGATVSIYMLYK